MGSNGANWNKLARGGVYMRIKFKIKLVNTAIKRYLLLQILTLKNDLLSDRVLYAFKSSQINSVEKTKVLGKYNSDEFFGKILQVGA